MMTDTLKLFRPRGLRRLLSADPFEDRGKGEGDAQEGRREEDVERQQVGGGPVGSEDLPDAADRITSYNVCYTKLLRNFRDGEYYGKEIPRAGLSLARMIGHITYLSDDSMHEKFGSYNFV